MQLDKKISEYRNRFSQFGVSPRSLKWKSEASMQLRHYELLFDLDVSGKSILDVGCGFGDLLLTLKNKAKEFRYFGVDMVEEFIEVAGRKYPEFEFSARDYFGHPLDKTFDIIVCSGALNSNFEHPLPYRRKAIRVMFDHAKEAVAFNMAGAHPKPAASNKSPVFYADSLDILGYCFRLTQKIIFRHHYHPKDFTIVLFK